jgi:hypothetical protein
LFRFVNFFFAMMTIANASIRHYVDEIFKGGKNKTHNKNRNFQQKEIITNGKFTRRLLFLNYLPPLDVLSAEVS